jgi:hypothetical protein
MPIEIKELHIKAVIGGNEQAEKQVRISEQEKEKIKKEITKAVMDNVMRQLQLKTER